MPNFFKSFFSGKSETPESEKQKNDQKNFEIFKYDALPICKDEWIKKIVYVPRNDENFISMGHEYELFYQNGPDGWVSLGRKTATELRLVYNNVPKNALLWLHNLSAGKEEQVFYMQNGQQIFLNKW